MKVKMWDFVQYTLRGKTYAARVVGLTTGFNVSLRVYFPPDHDSDYLYVKSAPFSTSKYEGHWNSLSSQHASQPESYLATL
jgi:hypothetical protein